ncbi:MAG TPA: hypothetical protein ENO21_04115 [Firmicutes bacterium]|nr:hypothetical protein [Bacillota bacterium]
MVTKSVVSNVDLVRRFVFEKGEPVSVDEIAAALRREMSSISSDEMARERYVLPVLKAQPYYRERDGKWEIERTKMPEYSVLEEVMREEHRLLYEREVRSKVAARLGVKVMTVVLDLEQAPELKQFGTRWGLKSWKVVNDEAAQILDQHPGGLNEKDLAKHISERFSLDPAQAILDLKRDAKKRFVADRKLWLLKEHYDKSKSAAADTGAALPDLKGKAVDLLLEGSFLEAQTARPEAAQKETQEAKTKLKKALKKQAQDIIDRREDLGGKEDLAAKLSQVLSAAGVDEYEVTSFQRVEPATKERGLSTRERDEIQQFIDQLLGEETAGVGPSLQSVVNAPLSARKMQDVLRLKYISYTRDRAVIPNEYYRLLVEILKPTIDSTFLNPSCFDGNLAVELFSYLFDKLEGAAWALPEDDGILEIVQPDGARYQLSSKDESLAETALDKFMISQVDLLNHFLNYKYTGIEPDKVLARAARVITRLSGHEGAYIVSKDFLTELPEVFSLPPNEDNEIPLRFDFVAGNLTFTQDANLAANYLDQSLRLLSTGGRCGVFVLSELLVLLKEHQLIGEFLKNKAVTHFVRLPVLEGRHNVVLLVVESMVDETAEVPIISARVSDFKSANTLAKAMERTPEEETGLEPFERAEQHALTLLIG